MPQQNEAPTRRAMWTDAHQGSPRLLAVRVNPLTFRFPYSTLLGGGSEHVLFLPNGDQRCGKKMRVSEMSFSPNNRLLSHFFAASEKKVLRCFFPSSSIAL
jgi:hypothetical protein